MKIEPDLGDAWAYFYKFEQAHGDEVSVWDCQEMNEISLKKILAQMSFSDEKNLCLLSICKGFTLSISYSKATVNR